MKVTSVKVITSDDGQECRSSCPFFNESDTEFGCLLFHRPMLNLQRLQECIGSDRGETHDE